jgi:hypothetical protein
VLSLSPYSFIEKGPFRRINLGNEYEDIVAAMRSRAIELLTEGASDLISSTTLDSFKVTLKYQDTDGEEWCVPKQKTTPHCYFHWMSPEILTVPLDFCVLLQYHHVEG